MKLKYKKKKKYGEENDNLIKNVFWIYVERPMKISKSRLSSAGRAHGF